MMMGDLVNLYFSRESGSENPPRSIADLEVAGIPALEAAEPQHPAGVLWTGYLVPVQKELFLLNRRTVCPPVRQPVSEPRQPPRNSALRSVKAPIAQWHIDVIEDVEFRNQVETLEDEPDLLVAYARALFVV